MGVHAEGVRIQITETAPDGTTRFVDETLPYAAGGGTPFRMTAPVPATSMSFRWTPGEFDFDFHLAPRRRLVLVIEGGLEITVGSGETRQFRPGDILSIRDTWGQGHRSRSADRRPFRSAFIALDDERLLDRREAVDEPGRDGIDYVHNQETASGISFFQRKRLPYAFGGPEGRETAESPLRAFQFVLAPGDLDYDWHPAPQRQAVLVLTGGLAMAYGDGSQSEVPPGGFLIGEDTDGRGHITRAIAGAERFSVFAHLA
jgi:hypothetical protein